MAIIRKGDKVAEEALKKRAREQSRNRLLASDETKRKAGLEGLGGKRVKKTQDGKTTATKVNKTAKITKSSSPVSGSKVTETKLLHISDPAKRKAALDKFRGRD
jgi:hypothetical protein